MDTTTIPGSYPAGSCLPVFIHDRDGIVSPQLDQSMVNMGMRVLRTPPRSPQADSVCERVIGTLRRECLDFMGPLTERHLRAVLKRWVAHYNQGRPHARNNTEKTCCTVEPMGCFHRAYSHSSN